MSFGILGQKIGMTQIFDSTGNVVPITVLDTSGCVITQVKTKDNDGYCSLQLGIGSKKPQNISKPRAGLFKKAAVEGKRLLQEFRLGDTTDMTTFKAGQTLSASMFQKGDKVDVIGTSKGKGFQGVMKKYNFSGKPATHGTAKHFRHTGSIGMHTFPGRVFKNKKMPSRMGGDRKTLQNLEIVDVRPEQNLILIKGSVPGANKDTVLIRSAIKKAPMEGRSWTGAAAATAEAPAQDQ